MIYIGPFWPTGRIYHKNIDCARLQYNRSKLKSALFSSYVLIIDKKAAVPYEILLAGGGRTMRITFVVIVP